MISDPELRDQIAGLYRDAYLARVGGQFISERVGGDTAGGRLMSSTGLPASRRQTAGRPDLSSRDSAAGRGSRRCRHLGGADMVNARLQELCDRADIFDCMYRYARGIDRIDRELLRSAYHDDAVDDHVGFVGPVDDFIDWPFAYHATQTRTPALSDEPHGGDQAIRRTRRPTTFSSEPTATPANP